MAKACSRLVFCKTILCIYIYIWLLYTFAYFMLLSFKKQDYVNMWLKVKQQCSGFPQGVTTETEKDLYIENYFKVQGIRLEKNEISKNPGLRLVAKLYLNRLVLMSVFSKKFKKFLK